MTGRHPFSKLRRKMLVSEIIKALRAGDREAYVKDDGNNCYRIDGRFDLEKVVDSLVDRLGEQKPARSEAIAAINETMDGLRIMRLENMVGAAYQVIGSLADATGTFEHPAVQKALGYFSQDDYDEDFLPWVIEDQPPTKA
jgi:hypothetical protein